MAEMISDSQGAIRVITVANPVVGNDFTHTMDARVRWRVISVKCHLVCDGNAGNRNVCLEVALGTDLLMKFHLVDHLLQNETWDITWAGSPLSGMSTASRTSGGCLPEKLLLNNEMTIRSATQAIKAGDQFTQIFILVEEWIEPLA